MTDSSLAQPALATLERRGSSQPGLGLALGRALHAVHALYDHVLAAFPDAYLEDPHDLPEIARRLRDHLERVSYDAPIRDAEDIGATPLAARIVNVKPSPGLPEPPCWEN